MERIKIISGDITKIEADAIVNALTKLYLVVEGWMVHT